MTEPGPITLAYLAAHPQDAARVMEQIDPAEVAAFIAEVPARLAAPALGGVAPWRAGRCLSELPPERAAAMVEGMPADRQALCLRTIPAPVREAILERMPRRRARALRRQLGYPAALVGAVMVGDMVTVPLDATVAEAREAIRTHSGGDVNQVYLVDAADRPAGAISLAALLTADANHLLRELARTELVAIAADMPLSQVSTEFDWHGAVERPVVDNRQRMIGTVTLELVLANRERPAGAISRGPGPAMVLGRSYVVGVTGLLRVVGGILAGGRHGNHGH